MSIIRKNGSLLDATETIIAHQVNGRGVMGAGLAATIKETYPDVFTRYHAFVKTFKTASEPLGLNYMVTSDGKPVYLYDGTGHIIANLFGQAMTGRNKAYTDEQALSKALRHLKAYAQANNYSVALPHGIGAGLGGGDWSRIEPIIATIFSDYDVTLYKLK